MQNIFLLIHIIFAVIMVLNLIFVLQKSYKINRENNDIRQFAKWYEIALTDDLTKIHNREAYRRYIELLESKSKKSRTVYGIVLFDIDDFKKINDTSGHLTGDKVLQNVALMLSEVFSAVNYSVYRIGGDEFAVITERASENQIIDLLLEIRRREEAGGTVRLSKGYAMVCSGESFEEAYSKADEMLYADKLSKKLAEHY